MEVMVFPTPMMIHQQVPAFTVHNYNVDGLLSVHSRIPIAHLSEQLKWHQRQIQEGTTNMQVYGIYLFVATVAIT